MKLVCMLCGRDKFIRRVPHYCVGGYRKRNIIWAIFNENCFFRFKRKNN